MVKKKEQDILFLVPFLHLILYQIPIHKTITFFNNGNNVIINKVS